MLKKILAVLLIWTIISVFNLPVFALPTDWKDCNRTSVGFKPLSDMGANDYYPNAADADREEGGLYGNGSNAPPSAHYQKAVTAISQIKPLNSSGQVDEANGKIGVVSLGMSNTTQVFSKFKEIADQIGSGKSSKVVLVDGAYNAQTAGKWSAGRGNPVFDPWTNMENMVSQAGLTKAQVQVFWIKLTNADPTYPKEIHPVFAQDLEADISVVVDRLNDASNGGYSYYPNTKVIYVSSRTYGGYTTTNLSPEPSAYESAFAMRYLIDDQQGTFTNPLANSNWVDITYSNAPVILWGPYLWADGMLPRSDGLIWECGDFEFDGVHPSVVSGRLKAANLLLNFFKTDSLAKTWFTGSGILPSTTPQPSATIAPSASILPSASTYEKGDVNHDGSVNANDAKLILDNYAKSSSQVPTYFDPVVDSKVSGMDFGVWRLFFQ